MPQDISDLLQKLNAECEVLKRRDPKQYAEKLAELEKLLQEFNGALKEALA